MSSVLEFLARERDRHLAELAEFARIPSISALPEHAGDIAACACWMRGRLERAGLEHARLFETGGNPIVYADWLHAGPDAPTALLYGHYDVQPVDPLELWETPPFEPTIRGGRIYARGVSDNKAQILLNVQALEALLATDGALPLNVKVIVEGEEELRADRLEDFVGRERDLLAADVAVVSDTCLYGRGIPGLPVGLRGMVALALTVRTAGTDMHSGVYGGTVPNALHAVGELVAGLHDPGTGRVAVEGFYDRVRELDAAERAEWAALPFDENALRAEVGVSELPGEHGYSPVERTWARPALDVHGIWGGFQGEGVKTVIPAVAHAKLSCRLVPDQDPHDVLTLLRAHLEQHRPPGAAVTVDFELAGARPVLTPRDHPAVGAALAALADAYDKEPVVFRAGWSVPIVEILARVAGLDSVMLGFALPDENFHAPNEHFHLENLDGGLRTMVAFWPRLVAALRPGA